MLINNPIFTRLIEIEPQFVNDMCLRVISEDLFNKEEIEYLRKTEQYRIELGEDPMVANFLPDDQRPKGVKKL